MLEAARKALMKSSLNSIYKDVLMVNSYIMVIDCLDKNNFINNINNLYEKYNILFIVTPFSLDINMNIPHFTMYEVLNLSTKAKIQELLDGQPLPTCLKY